MKTRNVTWAAAFLMFLSIHAPAATLYVDLNSTNPVPPYASWSTAATNIQDAVDASTNGDLILVTNGIYQTGGQLVSGDPYTTNRVAVTKAVTVQSVNGPSVTLVQGGLNIRCVYLTNGAALNGFTLTNGYSEFANGNGAGAYCESAGSVLSNCIFVNNITYDGNGGGVYEGTLINCGLSRNVTYQQPLDGGGGGAFNSVLYNCTIISNSASDGGGVYSCVLSNCSIIANSASLGGGAYESSLNNCLLAGNSSTGGGGGASVCILTDCVISNNLAFAGGGFSGSQSSSNSVLNNCILVGNLATSAGGGTYGGTLNNCKLVSNEIIDTNSSGYGGGAEQCTLNNCLLASNTVNIIISGGPSGSAIGGGADRSTLNNCTLIGNLVTNNVGTAGGGGAGNSALNNCTLIGNFSSDGGGGADACMLTNCLLYANSAYLEGGGAEGGTLINCTVVSNELTAPHPNDEAIEGGGGVYSSTVENCIIYYNFAISSYFATNSPNYFYPTQPYTITYSCTTPLPTNSANNVGDITNEPVFVDLSGANFRLQTNSPCINTGNNAYVAGLTDLDGRPRTIGGTVDIGAYEFQGPGMGEFIGWLQQYGLPTDGSVDYADLDGTGFNVYQDWVAGLNPTNSLSVLAMLPPVPTNNPAGLIVSWESVSNRTYFLQSSTNLGAQPAFSTIQSNIVGQPDMTSFMDTTATNGGPSFYRVGVQQ